MPTLPDTPNLDQLRRQAKDVLRAARAGDAGAAARIRCWSSELTLAAAQLALAREYGFASWPKLKDEVDARTRDLDEKAEAFLDASIRGRVARAAELLEETPAIAEHDVRAAVVLGEADRVRESLRRDPSLATRRDTHTGWTALHAACASRWYQLVPARAAGLRATVEVLIDAGADPVARVPTRRGGAGGWSPLRCAIAVSNSGPSNRQLVELLLDRGAVPDDHDLYLAGFAHDREQLLPLLIAHVPNLAEVAEQALAAPISNGDAESVRLLLETGADPRLYRDDDGRETPVVWAAVQAGCGGEVLELLVGHHADPNAAGPDGRTPFRLLTAAGRKDLADLLTDLGADETATDADRFLGACRRGDRARAERRLGDDPGLLARLSGDERAAIAHAAETGDTAAVALMLDLGFPIETRGDNGGTPLHLAAYAGSVDTVRLLLDRGADIEARDTTWDGTPLDWAAVGSGEQPRNVDDPDWVATVRTLIERGASTKDITLDPEEPKPPSPEVAEVLRAQLG